MSKRKWHHPEVPADEQVTRSWRSLGEQQSSEAFQKSFDREFPAAAAAMADEEDAEVSRRSFMKVMGASTALAGLGLASCRRPVSFIAPFAEAPEWVIPGTPLNYASAIPAASGAVPVVVTTYEGRPTKIEPNNLHPDSSGTNSFVQASILNLYSPARSRDVLSCGKKSSREALAGGLKEAQASAKAGKLALLLGKDESPTRTRLVKELQAKYTGLSVYTYEATADGGKVAAGSVLGKGVRLVADFAKADRILSLDCDFAGLDTLGPEKPFFERRQPEGKDYSNKASADHLNRLYVAEAAFSLTGGMADHRLRLKPSQILSALGFLAAELNLESLAAGIPALNDAKAEAWLKTCLEDLQSHSGRSVIAVGSRHSEAAHRLSIAINTALGNIGEKKALRAIAADTVESDSIEALTADIESGKVESLIISTPSNPVFDAPADLKFSEKLAKLKLSIHLGERVDHTATCCHWHIPAAHSLESWGDARSINGLYTIVQPLIHPLYDGVSELELLLALQDGEARLATANVDENIQSPAVFAVRKTFSGVSGDSSEATWKKSLRNGFIKKGASAPVFVSAGAQFESGKTKAAIVRAAVKSTGLEVIFATDHSVLDGRYIENGWLQEAPDPITKLTWDNAALLSPQTAKELGVYDEVIKLQPTTKIFGAEVENAPSSPSGEGETFKAPLVKVSVNGSTVEIPVLIAFGQADGVVVLPVGYGQGFDKEMRARDFRSFDPNVHAPCDAQVGDVARNAGFDVYPLRDSGSSFFAVGGSVTPTENNYKMALTQEHHAMYGRALAREVSTLDDGHGHDFDSQLQNVKKQGMDSHAPENISLYKPKGSTLFHGNKDGYDENLLNDDVFQWAMAIDLNTCTGCSACLVACQAENNIPIVGKQQVAMGREMHWIRMDRYFAATNKDAPDEVEMIPQPVGCVQCESAPCETVCPVNATVHTEDGLNAMAYNRCIGTRYCANNCPYKARRFNFFDYNKRNPLLDKNLYKGPLGKKMEGDSKHLQKNPNVTVRMRGVMEKCTYCVQRLKSARIKAKTVRKEKMLAGTDSTKVTVSPAELRAPANSVKVACQTACPTGAITFGNLLNGDKETVVRAKGNDSDVVRAVMGDSYTAVAGSKRNYDLLNYIGTRPRTSYLARVKNPNPKMADAKYVGTATIHMH